MKKSVQAQQNQLIRILQSRGVLTAGQLIQELDISRSTLSRLMTTASKSFIRLGHTTATQYGMLREITGLGSELPIYRVTETGQLKPTAKLLNLYQRNTVIEPTARVFSGLPPEIFDMVPQGFMGRTFAQQHAAVLGLPERLSDWSNDHILIAVGRRGEDLPGNLIFGKESADRWHRNHSQEIDRSQYTQCAIAAMSGQTAGSSAGGEQPKFTALVGGKHYLVKFSGIEDSPLQRRWSDLLLCEAMALEILSENGITSARTSIFQQGSITFLEIERFDRIGPRGRLALLTLAAVDNHLFGDRKSWSETAEKLERGHHISAEDSKKMKLLDAYGAFIGDSDRHFHNMALFPKQTLGDKYSSEKYTLAPAFDKLPMSFAPVSGQVVPRVYSLPVPSALQFDVWEHAKDLGMQFWNRVLKDKRISSPFKEIAQHARQVLK